MTHGGFMVKFETAEQAERAMEAAVAAVRGGWHGKLELHDLLICVNAKTAIAPEDYGPDAFDEGQCLFQTVCMAIALAEPAVPFEARCSYYDDDAGFSQSILAHYNSDVFSFRIKSTRKELSQIWRQGWYRWNGGPFQKNASSWRDYREIRYNLPQSGGNGAASE